MRGGEPELPRTPEFDTALSLIAGHLARALSAHGRNADYLHYRDDHVPLFGAVRRLASITLADDYCQSILGQGDVLQIKVPVKSARQGDNLTLVIDPDPAFFIVAHQEQGKTLETLVTPETYVVQFDDSATATIPDLTHKLLMYDVIPVAKPVL